MSIFVDDMCPGSFRTLTARFKYRDGKTFVYGICPVCKREIGKRSLSQYGKIVINSHKPPKPKPAAEQLEIGAPA